MNGPDRSIIDKIQELEQELENEIAEQSNRFQYSINEKRVEFSAGIVERHKKLKTGIIRFLWDIGLVHIIVSPIIYIQIIPLLFLDMATSLFQLIIFPVYSIPKVPREDFIVMDRHHLAYLNIIEKINCAFCGYANGVLAYAREIAGRTEAYWCPIKHARKTAGQHRRYYKFSEYGDGDGYRQNKRSNISKSMPSDF
ncbi:MAG: hypothetical protein OEL50_05745 [Rhodospirillaceae bacterium]|nr:hypothetical protein [Rhodospirillaceae bacterium]